MAIKSMIFRLAAVLLPLLLLPVALRAETRIALVIGNSNYQNAAALAAPRADADAMATSMGRLGFSVNKVIDASFDNFRRALLTFGREARFADIAVIYYSGHGLEMNGENWLIPIDAELKNDIDVNNEAISLHSLMQTVLSANKLGLIILDSCRQDPFLAKMRRSNQTRAVERGLARVEPNTNVLVAFAARDGSTADDGPGEHSPFTQALLNNIEVPGMEINFLFRNVRDDVLEQTHDTQEPFLYGSLSQDEIYLKPTTAPDKPSSSTAVSATVEMLADEIAWAYIQHSSEHIAYRGFLDQFPSSVHAAEARERMASLDAPQVATDAGGPVPAQPDEISWSFLSESTNLPSLHLFLEEFPTSHYAEAARVRIRSLEKLAQPDPGSMAPKALDTSTNGPAHARTNAGLVGGKEKVVAHHFRKMAPEVEQAWEVIKASKDPRTLLAFSEDFPTKHHKTFVQQKLADIGESSAPGQRRDNAYYVGECDRLAADPRDESKPRSVVGVEYGALDARHAAIACHQAILRQPEVARLKFQLCRCLVKQGDLGQATEQCAAAIRLAQAKGGGSTQLYSATSQAIQPLLASNGTSISPAPAAPTSDVNAGATGMSSSGGDTASGVDANVAAAPASSDTGKTGSGPSDMVRLHRHSTSPPPLKFPAAHFQAIQTNVHHTAGLIFRRVEQTRPLSTNTSKARVFNSTNLKGRAALTRTPNIMATGVRVRTPDIRVPTVSVRIPK